MFEIRVPDSSDSTQRISIENTLYLFRTYFNTRKKGWNFDLIDVDGNAVVEGAAIIQNQNLTYRYSNKQFEGDFVCLKVKSTIEPIKRNNLGFGKDYTILFLSPEELDLFNIER